MGTILTGYNMASPKTAAKPAEPPTPPEAPAPAAAAASADALRIATLEAQLAAAQATAAAAQITAAAQPIQRDMQQLFVGIRNVTNNTLGLPASPLQNEGAATLHAENDLPDPSTVAVVSYPYWLQLRKHKFYDMGLLVRDDSILGPTHAAAPPDELRDLAPRHESNLVLDPYAWIMSKDEVELKRAINAVTSEPSLRRLAWAVQQEVSRFYAAIPTDDPERLAKAENALSAKMAHAERLVEHRLMELTNPFRTEQ